MGRVAIPVVTRRVVLRCSSLTIGRVSARLSGNSDLVGDSILRLCREKRRTVARTPGHRRAAKPRRHRPCGTHAARRLALVASPVGNVANWQHFALGTIKAEAPEEAPALAESGWSSANPEAPGAPSSGAGSCHPRRRPPRWSVASKDASNASSSSYSPPSKIGGSKTTA